MTNSPLLGTVLLIAIAVFIWTAWRSASRQNYKTALFLVVLIGLLLNVYMSSDLFLHPWDERYHALVAKNMLSHPLKPTLFETPLLDYDYRMWSYNHIWLHKQPVPLWGIMSSLAVFGVNTIAVRIPSILLTSLGTVICFELGKNIFNRRVGLFSSFFFATNGLISELTSGRVATDHIDIFFLFFILLAVNLAWRVAQQKSIILTILCGICIGLAVLSKWLPALIVLPIWGAFVLRSKQFSFKEFIAYGSILVVSILVIALPWQLYIYSAFPLEAAWESNFNNRHIFESLEVTPQPWYYHFTMLRINYGELIYLPLIWFAYKTIKARSNWNYWALLLWIALPYAFFSYAQTKMQGYTLFAAPAVFIILGLFIHYLLIYRKVFRHKWVPIVGLVLLIGLPIRFTLERLKPFRQVTTPQWQTDILHLSEKIDSKEKVVVFNVNRPIELMFHANCTAYDVSPTTEELERVLNLGYLVYINQTHPTAQKGVLTIDYPSLSE